VDKLGQVNVENQTTSILSLLRTTSAVESKDSVSKQKVSESRSDGVFRQLLALQAKIGENPTPSTQSNTLPLSGNVLPDSVRIAATDPKLDLNILTQIKGMSRADLASLAEEIVDTNPAAITEFLIAAQKATTLIPASGVQLGDRSSVNLFEGSTAKLSGTPVWSDQELIRRAELAGISVDVAKKVMDAAQKSSRLTDADVLALSTETTTKQLQSKTAPGVVSAKEQAQTLMQQLNGQLRASFEKNTLGKQGGVATGDTKTDFTVIKSLQLEAGMGILRGTDAGTRMSTMAFLEQRGAFKQHIDPVNSNQSGQASLGVGIEDSLTLTIPDTARHAEAIQTKSGVLFKDALLNGQNEAQIQKALGERVMRMVESGNWKTDMDLNPSQLGSIRIRLSMENSELSLNLASTNPAVRELLEATLPRLREGLLDAGFDLAQSGVSSGEQGSTQSQEFAENSADSQSRFIAKSDAMSADVDGDNASPNSQSHDGELDAFA
jgi:flagellar hook-length control protein FliK